MKTTTRLLAVAALLTATLGGTPAMAQDAGLVLNQANSLDELLKNVQQRRVVEARDHAARETRFRSDKASQQRLLNDAQAERTPRRAALGAT